MKKRIIFTMIIIMMTSFVYAHHSMEYIDIESYTTARQGEVLAYLHYDYFTDDKRTRDADHWEFTPGFAVGIFDRLMFDIHCHYAAFGLDHVKESRKWQYPNGTSAFVEAFAASLQFRITEDGQLPINIAVSAIGEIPMRHAIDTIDASSVFGATLILGYDFGLHNNITANFSYERDGDDNVGTWSIGCKFVLSAEDEHSPAAGLEIIGDYEGHFYLLPGFYLSITQTTVFKIGLGVGMSQFISGLKNDGDKVEDYRAHASIMRRW